MTSTTAKATINALREIFSRQGLPERIISDNGPQFSSEEFQQFCAKNGIKHRTSAPYKPSTNGQAERVVQILKSAIKQAKITKENVDAVIARYLLVYRNTPHTTTGESPAMLLMKRRLRTRLDLIKPSLRSHVEGKQGYTIDKTSHRQLREFHTGENVMARNYAEGRKWMHGNVTKVLGSRHYIVDVQGRQWKRHVDQLIKSDQAQREVSTSASYTGSSSADVLPHPEVPRVPSNTTTSIDSHPYQPQGQGVTPIVPEGPPTPQAPTSAAESPRRYPTRERKPPSYLKDYEH